MNKKYCLIFILTLFAFTVKAQSLISIPTQSTTSTQWVTGYYFQAPKDFRIVKLHVPNDASTDVQSIQVCVSKTLVFDPEVRGYWSQIPTNDTVQANIRVNSGEYVFVLGQRGVGRGQAASSLGPTGAYTSSVLGVSVSLQRAESTIGIENGPTPYILRNANALGRILVFCDTVPENNIAVTDVIQLDACSNKQDIKAVFRNDGANTIDSFNINWSVNGVAQTALKYNSPFLASDTLDELDEATVTLKSNFSFNYLTDYEIKVWTSLPNGKNDVVTEDDTFVYNVRITGPPGSPTAGKFSRCGIGEVELTATPDDQGDSLFWYDAPTGQNILGYGSNFTTPFLSSNDTFYVEAKRVAKKDSFDNGFSGPYWYGGAANNTGTIDVIAKASDLFLEALTVKVQFNGVVNYQLYTKTGSKAGFEANASAWTLVKEDTATAFTYKGEDAVRIELNKIIPAGTTQAYAFFSDNAPILFTQGNAIIDKPYVKTDAGTVAATKFGGVINYSLDHMLEVIAPSCSGVSGRVAVPVEVIQLPIGADLEEGGTFEGTFAGGTMTDPDIVAEGDEIVYNLSNPTNYPNTSYGTTWEVTDTTFETVNGTKVNMGTIVFMPANGSSDGTFSYTAHDDFTDSTLKVSITIQDLNTLCDTVIERYIFVAPRPDAGFGLPAALCQGNAISFINRSTISSGGISYKWDFGDGDTSIAPNTSHIYAQPGTYTVKLTTTSTPYGYVTDTTAIITVEETPQANFNRTNACEGFNVELTNTTSYGGTGTVTYDWDFGDGSAHSSNTNESKLYNAPNSYVVTLVADVAGCRSSKSKTVYQFATPDVDFIVPSSSVCNHSEVNLINKSELLNGTMGAYWDFGNGVNSNMLDGKVTYGSASTFDVKLKMISEFGCTDSLTKQVVVSEGASADFEYDLACIENATNFTFSGDAPSGQSPLIVWTFDSEGQDGGASVSHNWQSLGSKNVQVKVVLNNGCNDSITKTIEVLDQPKVDFTYSGMCEDDAVIFQNNSSVGSGDLAYEWSFGDNTTSTKVSPTHQYTAGSYSVKLKASLAGACPDSLTKVVDISANPVCDFTIADEYVWGHRGFKFNPTDNSYPFYRWTFGEGGNSSDASPVYQYINDGQFSVTLFARNAAGCECEKTVQHDVNDVVGIDETSLNGVSVYPNPTTGQLTIDLPKAGEDYTIEVMNVIGKVVQTGAYTNATESIELNIGHQAKGIYLIKITSNNKSKTVKVNLLD